MFLVDTLCLFALFVMSTEKTMPAGYDLFLSSRAHNFFTIPAKLVISDCNESPEPIIESVGELNVDFTVNSDGAIPWEFLTNYGTEDLN